MPGRRVARCLAVRRWFIFFRGKVNKLETGSEGASDLFDSIVQESFGSSCAVPVSQLLTYPAHALFIKAATAAGGISMRRYQWMALLASVLVIGLSVRPAAAQPGHAPFDFADFEIEDFERSLVPAGVAGATIVSPAFVGDVRITQFDHPAVTANGGMAAPYQTGAPLFLEETHSAFEWWGGILGHTGATTHATQANYNDLFPGGFSMSPGGYPTKGSGAHWPSAITNSGEDTYTGTKISLVTNTDGNTADDVGITSGNQAMRVSVWNVGNGGEDTSFERPVMLTIKANDFWGVADERFNTWETVRANPSEYNVSVDVTILADEVPDTFAPTFGPYLRLGLISGHGGLFDESPPEILQGPDTLQFSNADADGDMLPNFSDPQFVDPGNTVGLPGVGVPGVIQRRYVFPASAMEFPTTPLAGVADIGNDGDAGGWNNAYMLGFVFNGNWQLTNPAPPPDTQGIKGIWGAFPQFFASFIVDNMKILPRNPLDNADFNDDNVLNAADWQILLANLNGLTPPAKTFAQGDIGSLVNEPLVSPGVVDFQDFVRFEEIWNANNGGDGAFQRFLAGVPEPSTFAMFVLGLVSVASLRRRAARQISALVVAIGMATWAGTASAALTNVLLFDYEAPILTVPPELQETQRWVPAGDAANTTTPPTLARTALAATQGSTRGLAITQTGQGFSWDASVSQFDAEDGGLPTQAQAWAAALDNGADNYVLEMDVKYLNSQIPDTGFVNMSVRLSAGSSVTDQVNDLALAVSDVNFNIADQTIPVSIPLSPISITPVVTTDGILSVPQMASDAGFYNISVGFNGDWGTGASTFNIDNVRLRQVTLPPLLTLEVNTTTNVARIRNVPGADAGTGDVVFDYYEVRSLTPEQNADFNDNGTVDTADYTIWRNNLGLTGTATKDTGDANGDTNVTAADFDLWKDAFNRQEGANESSLNPAGWNSLDDQNVDPDGVLVTNNWLESGSPNVSALSEARLIGSSTWSSNESLPIGAIFAAGQEHNLVFRYREPSRPTFLRTGLVTYVTSGAGGGSAVPEPGTMVLAILAAFGLAAVKRR